MTDTESLPLSAPREWESPSGDPNDETFGDVVTTVDSADDLKDYDAVFVGEPFDAAIVGRAGAGAGPDAIRESLAGVKTWQFASGRIGGDGEMPTIADVGNVNPDGLGHVSDTDVRMIRDAASRVGRAVHESSATPVFLGGDNSMTVPNVRALMETTPDTETVGVVNFDAHLDVREVHDAPTSGTPYRELLKDGLAAYAVVGARDFETSGEYINHLREQGWTVVTSKAVGRNPDGALAQARKAVADVEYLYCSVDCDVLDAAHAPGVSAPTPGGLTTRELFDLVGRLVTDQRLRGIEVVECAPPLDSGRRTVDAAARTVAHALGGLFGETEDGGSG